MYDHAPDRVCQKKQDAIYFMSTLEKHSARKKAPKPTESVVEAALKASGPMPRALLIVTSAFLSSNSDWWVHQGGVGVGGYSSEETGSVWWWKTLCSSPISPVRGLTRGIQGCGAFAAPSMDTGLVSLPPPPPHPTYKTLLSRLISSVLYCHPDLNELPCSSCSWHLLSRLPPPPAHAFCGAFHFLNNQWVIKSQIISMFTIYMVCPQSRGAH